MLKLKNLKYIAFLIEASCSNIFLCIHNLPLPDPRVTKCGNPDTTHTNKLAVAMYWLLLFIIAFIPWSKFIHELN